MRTLIDIPEDQLQTLNQLARRQQVSRAELIRRAVRKYLKSQMPLAEDEAFGLWKETAEDGLAYQRRLRDEW